MAVLLFNKRFCVCLGLALPAMSQMALGGIVTGYSYRHVNRDGTGQEVVYENNVGPVPMPSLQANEQPNGSHGSYSFDVSASQSSTSLSARAKLNVSVNQQTDPNDQFWKSVMASAEALSSLVEFGTVQGAPGVPGGTIAFSWVVDGPADLRLDATGGNLVEVVQLSTTARLESTIPGYGGVLLDDIRSFPDETSFNQDWQQVFPSVSDVVSHEVPWTAGEEVPVFFDLQARVDLHLRAIDAAAFESLLDLDLSNTATLMDVDIMDGSGNLIPDAQLVFAATPEPRYTASLLFAAIWLCLVFKAARMKVCT